jgi:hypothetical protein
MLIVREAMGCLAMAALKVARELDRKVEKILQQAAA